MTSFDIDGSGSFPIPSCDQLTGGFLRRVTTNTTATELYGAAEPITGASIKQLLDLAA